MSDGKSWLIIVIIEVVKNSNPSRVFPSQSIMAAIAFSYSNVLQLPWQLLLLVVTGFMGTLSFFLAEWLVVAKRRDSDYDSI